MRKRPASSRGQAGRLLYVPLQQNVPGEYRGEMRVIVLQHRIPSRAPVIQGGATHMAAGRTDPCRSGGELLSYLSS